jgi:hypothetical protein
MRTGLVAEFRTPEEMLHALRGLRARGYTELDAFTPYPVKGAAEALGLGRSKLNWIVFALGISGAGSAYLLEWYCNAYDYPINVGGRPLHSAPAFIPISFEMGVLAAALGGLFLFFLSAGLPELSSPVFDVEGFERASIDRFWAFVDERDPSFYPERAERDLNELGALRVASAGARLR